MQKINITHVNPTDTEGGASLAGYRLHQELAKHTGIDSILFVGTKYSNDARVIEFRNIFTKIIEKLLMKINTFTGMQYLLSINWLNLLFFKRFRKTDIFVLRNIHGDYLPFWFPWLLSKFAPVIWRLPDEWAYTGHCAYSYECTKWQIGCNSCPHLDEYPKLRFDTTYVLFRLKKFFYQRSNIHLVAPSTWIYNNLCISPIFESKEISYIPIGVDIDLFSPMKKFDNFSISFVSVSLDDYRKGGTIIEEIFELFNAYLEQKNITVDIYLIGKKVGLKQFKYIHYHFTGFLDEKQIASYYAKTHLNILPTLADNLPNTILESLSCGTPVVSFDTGGCKDLVKHKQTGYLAKYQDLYDFVNGIKYFLDYTDCLKQNAANARTLVEEAFTMQNQSNQYLKLIKQILHES